ncbi:hypothetical protein [Plantibacter sp. CFBP 8804]|uniref:hypothetical protein n=1 Tax=Plantibacter sp. CFBP 8804 TaxID=2775270 RepID=UPI00177ABECB|nr:hypothetical protein [Plantibacter sp. CFBP 8804]MBD8518628.1 hypothetical protein [Plantibacter sp. CFBP 8804]
MSFRRAADRAAVRAVRLPAGVAVLVFTVANSIGVPASSPMLEWLSCGVQRPSIADWYREASSFRLRSACRAKDPI